LNEANASLILINSSIKEERETGSQNIYGGNYSSHYRHSRAAKEGKEDGVGAGARGGAGAGGAGV